MAAVNHAYDLGLGSGEGSPHLENERVGNLRFCTFNLLAPCYKRLPPKIGGSSRIEAEYVRTWNTRLNHTLQFLQDHVLSDVDILALQEYWFDDGYQRAFQEFLGPDFEVRICRRSGSKEDGVALVIRKGRLQIQAEKCIYLGTVGSRVALALRLHDQFLDQPLLVTATHLTFPHEDFSKATQLNQGKLLCAEIDTFAAEQELSSHIPRIIMGDFNAELADPVCKYMISQGYTDSFAELSAARHSSRSFVSHHNHRGESLGVDHLFFRPIIHHPATTNNSPSHNATMTSCHVTVEDWYLSPRDMDPSQWPEEYCISDHRPAHTLLRIATTTGTTTGTTGTGAGSGGTTASSVSSPEAPPPQAA